MWQRLSLALSFLTIFRLPFVPQATADSKELAASFTCFPLVGAFVGILSATLAAVASGAIPSLVLAVLITSLLALLTRALHLDGVADLADGLGGGYTPERRLAIMKDSRIGAFGAIALILLLQMKVAALDTIISHAAWAPILIAPTLSRLAMVYMAFRAPSARKAGGLGQTFLEGMTSSHLSGAVWLGMLWCAGVSFRLTLWLVPTAWVCTILLRRLAVKSLGGITGDVLGATNEIVETVLLALAASLSRP